MEVSIGSKTSHRKVQHQYRINHTMVRNKKNFASFMEISRDSYPFKHSLKFAVDKNLRRSTAKGTAWYVCQAKTEIRLNICAVWSESLLGTLLVAKVQMILNMDSKLSGCACWSESAPGKHAKLYTLLSPGSILRTKSLIFQVNHLKFVVGCSHPKLFYGLTNHTGSSGVFRPDPLTSQKGIDVRLTLSEWTTLPWLNPSCKYNLFNKHNCYDN